MKDTHTTPPNKKRGALMLMFVAGCTLFFYGLYLGIRKDKETPLPPTNTWSIERILRDDNIVGWCINYDGFSSTSTKRNRDKWGKMSGVKAIGDEVTSFCSIRFATNHE